MPQIEFAKMHAQGNDFVVLDGAASGIERFDERQASMLADRHAGIGADQILLLTGSEEGEEFSYRIWNADGGEVAQCGNGARAAFFFLRRRSQCAETAKLRTSAGVITVEAAADGARAYLAVPCFDAKQDAAATREYRGCEYTALDLGNPHAVFLVDDVATAPVEEIGAALNEERIDFPDGVNAGFGRLSGSSAELRVYERGAKETKACGSGAAALAVVAFLRSSVAELDIKVAGGALRAGWQGGEAAAWVEGEVVHVFDGVIKIP